MTSDSVTRETHGAWVHLRGDRALKIKKPVRYPFMDYSTLDKRLAACRREVDVNQELAPGTYLGVRALLPGTGQPVLGPPAPHPDAVEYAIEMRRFDESRTMAALIRAGALSAEDVDSAARRIAEFHRRAPICGSTGAAPFRERVERDLSDLTSLQDASVLVRMPAMRRLAQSISRRLGASLDSRAARGLRRDGHGDLRADHVVLEDPLIIVDRVEFDDSMRCCDVASDLSFLTMDLEARGAAWAAQRLVDTYRAAGGDPGGPREHAAFAWQRALVRVKVEILSGDPDRAREYLLLADRIAWRVRSPAVLLIGGPPASGKSTLAREVSRLTGSPVVSSDVVRKQLLGLRPEQRAGGDAYSAAMTLRTYEEVAAQAARELRRAPSVIIDATLGTRELRALLLKELDGAAPLVMVLCRSGAGTIRRRAEQRAAQPERISDADEEVAQRLASSFEAADEPAVRGRVCEVSTEHTLEHALDMLAQWLDENLPA